MASHKFTFSLPEDLSRRFLRRVPARMRSLYVSEALEAKLREEDNRLALACDAANKDLDIAAIEREWDTTADPIAEPWVDAEAR